MASFSEFEQELLDAAQEMVDVENGLKPPAKRVVVYHINIEQLRQKLEVSQQEFAEGLGISLNTVKNWEERRSIPKGLAGKILRIIRADPSIFKILADMP